MNPLRKLFRDLISDSLEGYRVDVRVRTPDGEARPVTLVLGEDGIVRWEYRDGEDCA